MILVGIQPPAVQRPSPRGKVDVSSSTVIRKHGYRSSNSTRINMVIVVEAALVIVIAIVAVTVTRVVTVLRAVTVIAVLMAPIQCFK